MTGSVSPNFVPTFCYFGYQSDTVDTVDWQQGVLGSSLRGGGGSESVVSDDRLTFERDSP